MKKITLLGSTGSIGRQTIEVLRQLRPRAKIVALTAHSNIELLTAQVREFKPAMAALWRESDAEVLRTWCRANRVPTKVLSGMDGLMTAAQMESDVVVSAVVGAIGLKPLVAAIRSRRTVALANKEALVVAGDLVMKEARRHGATILPVDSEHSAIFQCLKDESHDEVNKILLTASGGPFYRSKKSSAAITVTDALAHPTWMMGKKITIDSATLMNKGLEAIEAHHLFNVPLDRIEIVIHPQSIIHSMVEYVDGSVIAQMSLPDMRLPIQYAITYPARKPAPVQRLDLLQGVTLQFDRPDFKRFPCLGLALEAGLTGGTMPVVMNAANETAVNLFLNEKISFNDIPRIIERVMHSYSAKKNPDLDEIIAVDTEARLKAEEIVLGNVSYRNGRTSKRKS